MSYSFVSATFAMAACRAALANRRRSGRSATRTTSGGGAGRGDGEGTRAGLNFDPAQRHDVDAQARPGGAVGRLGGGRLWAAGGVPFLTPLGHARGTDLWRRALFGVRKELSVQPRTEERSRPGILLGWYSRGRGEKQHVGVSV